MQTGDDRSILVSTMPATSRDRRVALAVVSISLVLFACAVPFAAVPLAPVPAFVASYQSALAINDLITAGSIQGDCYSPSHIASSTSRE